ncbi:hypothetical protein ACWD4B_11565 [Streptomyces sp. NPDC002536]
MRDIGLRPEAVGPRDVFSFLKNLDLDCDVNPCTGSAGPADPARISDPEAFHAYVRRLGLCAALADVLDIGEHEALSSLVLHDTVVGGDTGALTELVSAYHNARPLRLDEAVHIACWPHVSGAYVVFIKINHLVADLPDAIHLFRQLRGYLLGPRGEEGCPEHGERTGSRYRGHRAALLRYAEEPAADVEEVERALGPVPVPDRKGIPTISASTGRWLPLREGITFNAFLSEVTAVLQRHVSGDLVLQYPFSRRSFNGEPGYFGEIRPLVVRSRSTDPGAPAYTPEYFRETRRFHESLGRFTMSDLPSFAAAFARGRMPRIVVSDTTFMRPDPAEWRWVPVHSARTFEDLKFLIDRGWPGPPLLRLQYKRKFLTPETVTTLLDDIEQRIGAQWNSRAC